MDKQKLRKKIRKKRTDSNNTTHTTMGTPEDVKVSYKATRLFPYERFREGQPLTRADPAGFSPEVRSSCSLLHSLRRGWKSSATLLTQGFNSTMITQHGFVVLEGQSVMERDILPQLWEILNWTCNLILVLQELWLAFYSLWHCAAVGTALTISIYYT